MTLVIDSSVALKWFVAEPRHEIAKRVILSGDRRVAPEWAYAEVTNALWRKMRVGETQADQVLSAISELPRYVEFQSCNEAVMVAAFELARLLEHSIYDCVFLAMALTIPDAILVTDDQRFAEKVASNGYGDKTRRLNDDPLILAFSEPQLERFRRLYETSRRTFEAVAERVGQLVGAGNIRVVSGADLKPARESPTYVALKRDVGRLSRHQVQTLLAIAWLGRGYDGDNFERLYGQAAHLAAAPDQHAAYIISLMGHLDRGVAAYRLSHSVDSEDGLPHG